MRGQRKIGREWTYWSTNSDGYRTGSFGYSYKANGLQGEMQPTREPGGLTKWVCVLTRDGEEVLRVEEDNHWDLAALVAEEVAEL